MLKYIRESLTNYHLLHCWLAALRNGFMNFVSYLSVFLEIVSGCFIKTSGAMDQWEKKMQPKKIRHIFYCRAKILHIFQINQSKSFHLNHAAKSNDNSLSLTLKVQKPIEVLIKTQIYPLQSIYFESITWLSLLLCSRVIIYILHFRGRKREIKGK